MDTPVFSGSERNNHLSKLVQTGNNSIVTDANVTGQRGDTKGNASLAPGGEVVSLGISPDLSQAVITSIRALDIVVSTVILLFVLPVFAILAILIRFDSPGSVLFIQNRVGRDGVEFPFYKFRSMVTDAEALRVTLESQNERNGPVFKMREDPRITKVGRFMRKYSLDELPQLINVLKGEMSLVGPRPALPKEVALYSHRQSQRLAVTPGITGLWQVSGRSNVSFEHSVELDLHYIQNKSFWLNLRILWMTIPAVLTADGAY